MKTLMSVFAALSFCSLAQAADIELGKVVAENVCAECHSMDGKGGNAKTPYIAGQKLDYILHVMKEYRDGVRKSRSMNAYVADLTDEELENVSAYYSSLSGWN